MYSKELRGDKNYLKFKSCPDKTNNKLTLLQGTVIITSLYYVMQRRCPGRIDETLWTAQSWSTDRFVQVHTEAY